MVSLKGSWCSKWKRGIYSLYEDLNALDCIEIRRIGWTGDVTRIEEENDSRKVLNL